MKPEPKPSHVVCTVCGLAWEPHLAGPRKKSPNLEDCVRVLKAELASRPRVFSQRLSMATASAFPFSSYSGVPLHANDLGKAQ